MHTLEHVLHEGGRCPLGTAVIQLWIERRQSCLTATPVAQALLHWLAPDGPHQANEPQHNHQPYGKQQ
jgi:hypothetical protein